ncbi:MAG TPA: organic hydroperoxide resistance protein [Actinoplanes sp.]|nr:organic hydroperoxide resistance protein [Actinoplanes sp.]
MTDVLYTASATATGDGRNGHVRSSDGVLDFDLAMPKELGGAGGAFSNPEQLFAAGYAACFHSALKRVASMQKIKLEDTAITVDVSIGALPTGGFGLSAVIEAELPGLDETTAKAVLDAAHQICPYSNATRGNIEVKLNLA